MTKVLTILVAAEHIMEEELDDTFTMTREITDYSYINDCSSVGFLEGEQVTIRDMFYGTILPSGCDAAVGLATYVAGSHDIPTVSSGCFQNPCCMSSMTLPQVQ